jgi:hypothetical protein
MTEDWHHCRVCGKPAIGFFWTTALNGGMRKVWEMDHLHMVKVTDDE